MRKSFAVLASVIIVALCVELVIQNSEANLYRQKYHDALYDEAVLQYKYIRMLLNYSSLQDQYIELFNLLANYTNG
jgi:hypothetical protein